MIKSRKNLLEEKVENKNIRFVYKPDFQESSMENVKIGLHQDNEGYTAICVSESGTFAVNSKTGDSIPFDKYCETLEKVDCESCENYSKDIEEMEEKKVLDDLWVVNMKQDKRKPGMGRIIVRKFSEEIIRGGIILPDNELSELQLTKILALGELKGTYNIGDRCFVHRRAGIDLGFDDIAILEGDIIYTEPSE